MIDSATAITGDRPFVPATGRRPRHVKLLVAGAIVVLAIGQLVVTNLGSATVYYLTVGELQAQRGPPGRLVRVSGDVAAGSIAHDGATVRFTIVDPGGSLPVVYRGVVPDIFGEAIQVVVEGQPDASGVFQASTLLAKCPSRFEAEPGAAA
ncbi:MAG TPA: cytochrome c maturation protein CcmE [Chloroflexota bacterium]|jgi:cytochrome c-type biogenesis protein CcmE